MKHELSPVDRLTFQGHQLGPIVTHASNESARRLNKLASNYRNSSIRAPGKGTRVDEKLRDLCGVDLDRSRIWCSINKTKFRVMFLFLARFFLKPINVSRFIQFERHRTVNGAKSKIFKVVQESG